MLRQPPRTRSPRSLHRHAPALRSTAVVYEGPCGNYRTRPAAFDGGRNRTGLAGGCPRRGRCGADLATRPALEVVGHTVGVSPPRGDGLTPHGVVLTAPAAHEREVHVVALPNRPQARMPRTVLPPQAVVEMPPPGRPWPPRPSRERGAGRAGTPGTCSLAALMSRWSCTSMPPPTRCSSTTAIRSAPPAPPPNTVSVSGERSVAIGGDNSGTVSTGAQRQGQSQ